MFNLSGSVIRTMSESSSCVMQLAEMNDPMNVKERIMIVSSKDGNLPHLVHVSNRANALQCYFVSTVTLLTASRHSKGREFLDYNPLQ